jgi:hypothetical protein
VQVVVPNFVRRAAELFLPPQIRATNQPSKTKRRSFEAPTVACYEGGQVPKPHYDANHLPLLKMPIEEDKTLANSWIVYLNDVQEGDAVWKVDIVVHPQTGGGD